jgi:hypothetical protein
MTGFRNTKVENGGALLWYMNLGQAFAAQHTVQAEATAACPTPHSRDTICTTHCCENYYD